MKKALKILLGIILGVAAISTISKNPTLSSFLIIIVIIYMLYLLIREIYEKIKSNRSKKQPKPQRQPGIVSENHTEKATEKYKTESFENHIEKKVTIDTDDFSDFGIYTPKYKFMDAETYVKRLKEVRDRQKDMIRSKTACIFPRDLAYNGNKREGAAMVNDWMKLILRAFNGESEAIISKVRFDNYAVLEKRILSSAESINKLGARIGIKITAEYVMLKVDELRIAYDYEQFKQDEKERLRQIREEEIEKAKVQKELNDKLKKVEKDLTHIETEKKALQSRIDQAEEDEDVSTLQAELDKLELKEAELTAEKEDIAEREVNAKAGYVYIISNIGSFGENVYKIGMTRRLDPQERVDELGDASVPFTFDVHAFIFSTDAVALETALHHKFEQNRVNMINPRKEFFAVTLDDIEKEVKQNFNGSVEFHRTAAAVQYRETLALRKRMSA